MQSPPTNQPTNPNQTYVSLRITISISQWYNVVKEVLSDVDQLIAYPHEGIKTKKEHFHVCIPVSSEDAKKAAEKYRKRARDYLGITGRSNAVAALVYSNGYQSFVTYARHKACGDPIVSGAEMQEAVDSAPAWDSSRSGQTLLPFLEDKPDKVRDWQLTYSNLVPQAIIHAQRRGLTGGLKEVVADMIDNTKWKPCPQMTKCGVPPFYIDSFAMRTGKKAKHDMSWFDFKG